MFSTVCKRYLSYISTAANKHVPPSAVDESCIPLQKEQDGQLISPLIAVRWTQSAPTRSVAESMSTDAISKMPVSLTNNLSRRPDAIAFTIGVTFQSLRQCWLSNS